MALDAELHRFIIPAQSPQLQAAAAKDDDDFVIVFDEREAYSEKAKRYC